MFLRFEGVELTYDYFVRHNAVTADFGLIYEASLRKKQSNVKTEIKSLGILYPRAPRRATKDLSQKHGVKKMEMICF